MNFKDKLRGYLWGSAIGDALGQPVEFLQYETIIQEYGEGGIKELPERAQWTDDTQMMLAIAYALGKQGDQEKTNILDAIAASFKKWYENPGISPGETCIRSVLKLREGVHWSESGINNSKGCGSVMRSGIIGLIYQNDKETLIEIASKSGRMTHGHPTADAACIAGALVTKYILDGKHPREFQQLLFEDIGQISDEFNQSLKLAYDLANGGPSSPQTLMEIGEGWIAEEAFAMAMYCVLSYVDDYKKCILLAANVTGDSDSIACIAGGILGLIIGYDSISKEMITNLKDNWILKDFVKPLLNVRETIDGKMSPV